MQTIRWGIIGCGDVTEVKSGPAFNKIPNSKLVAVMRRDAAKAEDYARRHNVPKWYADATALINDPEVDAVYIATPPGSHHDYTLQVAAAGKPVYVEKPMARTYAECQEMIAACEKAQLPLFVAFYRRRLPSFLKVKELVDTGAIGEVRFVNIQLYHPLQNNLEKDNLPWRVQPDIAGGGLFFDLAPHQLDILDYILGPIASASGQTANQANQYPAEDIVTAQYRFASGVLGSGTWCFTVADNQRTDRMELFGSQGKITFAAFDKVPVLLETAAGKQEFDLPPPPHIQQPFIQTIVEQLTGQGECPSTGVTAARTAWVMDQIVGR
ncbi:Gfo/Idh/MocA family protein [Adhaeribacter pallidiroseus]|uniref:Inositol 2-dehydrogenase n=1 Tax=Adhaeribacter pallidiroseus TaxID=2072847 RepID=A0A369QK60_9BACT|nr:Gfo/Idh/MocA family oxidoreductase [Adhaeribacter pallidiroseus]RDC65313.1 Inositol 2-dehydrogenase [Adhaeribacter pallidiroseus]